MFFVTDTLNELMTTADESATDAEARNLKPRNPAATTPTNAQHIESEQTVFFFSSDVAWDLLLRRPHRFPGAST
ncbi:MAG: hypothetical protein IPK60_05300 [Sandaracinaceae bacterium]|jgi:hypothetical protein|nr:hypothetical protein [Sandaracinaceae bacterium]